MYPGVDIIEIERFARACERQPKLRERLFTLRERMDLQDKGISSWAVRFAGKEAVLKTFGTGLRGLSWQDIEIVTLHSGEPVVYLSSRAKEAAALRGGTEVRISLSHDSSRAIALAILL